MSPDATLIARAVVTDPMAFTDELRKLNDEEEVLAATVVNEPAAAAVPPIAGGEAR
jgi:L-lysine 2,3-aminomutase